VDVYIIAVALISLLLYGLIFTPVTDLDWMGLAIFTLMVITTEWLSIDIYDARGAVSTSTAPMLAAILLVGPIAAPVVSLALATVAWIKNRSPINRLIFNFANQLIAATIFLELIKLSGREFVDYPPLLQFVTSIGATGIVYLITTSLITFGVSLDLDARVKEIWMEKFSWLAPYYLAMGLIAYALVFSYLSAGVLGAIIVLIPLMLLRLSQVQYINRTKRVVQEIREKNLAMEQDAGEIQRLNDGLLFTLAEIIDLRDPHVMGHSRQVARYAVLIAEQLRLPDRQVELVRKAALLHDIGKMSISESILFKPEKLTEPENEIVKDHVNLGAEILESSVSLRNLIPIIRYHHEHYDGRGYPEQIKGNAIPIEARILSVADAIETMASDRPHRQAMSPAEIMEELRDQSGAQFDPRVVQAFIDFVQYQAEPVIVNLARKPFMAHEMDAAELEEAK
jgi:putative nucleotidyltransferase with HDIG domain